MYKLNMKKGKSKKLIKKAKYLEKLAHYSLLSEA